MSYEAAHVCDAGSLSIDIYSGDKKVHSCYSYFTFPEDMNVLSEYVHYLVTDDDGRASMREEWEENGYEIS